MDHQHAVVWIDHREAHVVRFGPSGSNAHKIRSESHEHQIHHKANSIGDGRALPDVKFSNAVARDLEGLSSIVVVGPGSAKGELVEHLKHHQPSIARAIVGIEALDHPTDGELLRFARKYARAADRLRHE